MFLEIPQGSEGDSNCISLKQVALPKLTAEYQALTHQAPYTGKIFNKHLHKWPTYLREEPPHGREWPPHFRKEVPHFGEWPPHKKSQCMGQNLVTGWCMGTSFTTPPFSAASGVASSVGYLVCKCLILSGQCRQCRVAVFIALDGPKT